MRYLHPDLGLNSRLDEVQAAILSERLRWLPSFTARRRAVAERYQAEHRQPRRAAARRPLAPESHVHHLYVLACATRGRLARHLEASGVQTLIHYPVPVHHQEPCLDIRRDPSGLPHAEQHALTCLSIPCQPQLTDHEVDAVIAAVNSYRP